MNDSRYKHRGAHDHEEPASGGTGAQPAVQYSRFGEKYDAESQADPTEEADGTPIQPAPSSGRDEHETQSEVDDGHKGRVVKSCHGGLVRFCSKLEACLGDTYSLYPAAFFGFDAF